MNVTDDLDVGRRRGGRARAARGRPPERGCGHRVPAGDIECRLGLQPRNSVDRDAVTLLKRDNGFLGCCAERAVDRQVGATVSVKFSLQLGHASAGRIAGVQDRAVVEIYGRERFSLGGEGRWLRSVARARADRDGRHHGECQTSRCNGR